ncbi:MAG TPA: hypothetical protein VKE51_41270 [Vicinamibacterales bacterium]|nr:hypothetical protein [Vicinamibacterales bacterium]
MSLKTSIIYAGLAAGIAAALVVPSTMPTPWRAPVLLADSLNCNVSQYKAAQGLTAAVEQDSLLVSWTGQNGADLRARYAIDGGQPVVRELAVRKAGGQWTTLGRNLTPEYHVVSGIRRMADDQANPLRAAGVELTEEVISKNRWYAFWDAPLVMPGSQEMKDEAAWQRSQQPQEGRGGGRGGRGEGQGQPRDPLVPNRTLGTPRTPSEIKRADSSFHTTSCSVKTDGASLVVTFPGLSMGIFSGDLQFTVYKGTNLVRMDAAAKTNEPWVAYKYDAGLKGFTTDLTPRVSWRDTGGHPQSNQFGGAINTSLARVKAQNRLIVVEAGGGAIAAFPPPHTFFFTREKDTNLGYVWYRKDAEGKFGVGVGMPEREEEPRYVQNFALYNAPPGTVQKMGVYFYASPEAGEPVRQAALAFTHGDAFKPIPGYKTFVNHFHLDFTGRQRLSGSLDTPFQDLAAMKSLGLNVIGLSDFHFELHANDPGPLRLADQKDYFEASRRASDRDFLVVPWEEPSAFFGGHYNIVWPKDVYWTKVRPAGQPFVEEVQGYGKVYHTGSAEDVQKMMDAEGAYWYHAHPRTKNTTGYPDLIFDKPYVKNDRYLGVAFKPGMGQDNSEARMCDWRCFDAIDTMNNRYANLGLDPKYVIADIDTYRKGPEDDLYANFPVNYLKIDRTPGPNDDYSPILKSLRDGNFFVTTGEILIRNYAVAGTGNQRTISADVDWTFPLNFVEVVWGDGKKVDRQVIPATDLAPFGTKRFAIPFDAAGKSWVRFAAWDSAGNGAFVQPMWVAPKAGQTTAGR